jgi:serine-type D-Ala-D-Ala carboxypeptidase/endopeptidase (penicillin-binding protein 4)
MPTSLFSPFRRPVALPLFLLILLGSVGLAAERPIATEIRQLVEAGNLGGIVGIYVVDAATSEVVVDMNGEKPMKPASNNKLLTTGAGLSLLGPGYRFVTEVLHTGTVRGDTLAGNLVVCGGGDPTISGRFETDKKNVTRALKDWADELTSKGIRRIKGNIIADATFFDRDSFLDSWYPAERAEWYEAEIWGLSFNDNCIDITWSGQNRLPGEKAGMTLNPVTKYATVSNNVTVSARGRTSERSYTRPEFSSDITATGTITVDTSKDDSAAIHNGALYFVTVFHEVLTSAGIEVTGRPMQATPEAARRMRRTAKPLLTPHKSPPLSEVVKVVNLVSQNFYAECIAKTIGRVKRRSGSFRAGTDEILEFWRRAEIFHTGNQMVDGSGLSERNHVSPRQLAEVLRYMDRGPLRDAWRESLPQGGVRGSLKRRFQETTSSRELAPGIFGKTGLIGGVRSLSGLVKNAAGHEWYYSIVLNDFPEKRGSRALALIDSVALALARSRE